MGEKCVEREPWEEFETVRKAAIDALRCGQHIARSPLSVICQLLVLPSFEDAIRWDVVEASSPPNGRQLHLQRTIWRMEVDSGAFRSPIERLKHPRPYLPTIETGIVNVNSARLDSILSQFRTIRIPLAVEDPQSGLDGTAFELRLGGPFCSARIAWRCNLPNEWREFHPVVRDLEAFFNDSWSAESG
jgi:hypothetical protein